MQRIDDYGCELFVSGESNNIVYLRNEIEKIRRNVIDRFDWTNIQANDCVKPAKKEIRVAVAGK